MRNSTELKEQPNPMWFKDHVEVLSDPAQSIVVNIVVNIVVSEEDYRVFTVYRYNIIQSIIIDHINARMESTDLISAISVFDQHHLPDIKDKHYGMDKILKWTISIEL